MFVTVVLAAALYTVHPGNTLSGIAAAHDMSWVQLYDDNQHTIRNPNLIYPGQVLSLAPDDSDSQEAPSVAPSSDTPSVPSNGPSDISQVVNPDDYSGFQQCVITRESGGNSQVMNSTQHYGLYQFSEQTWVAYGGSAADFGYASVGEQNQVFANAMAAGGESNWSDYDHCLEGAFHGTAHNHNPHR
jgi:LysM repeat protein